VRVDGTNRRWTLLACILSSSLVGVDSMMTTVALPAIAEDLDVGLAGQQWVVAAFLVALGSLVLVGGALDDLYDSWRIFRIGTAGFGAAALVSALAPNLALLIGGRLLQGAMAALLIPSVLAVIMSTFAGDDRSRAIGAWTAWSGVSIILGPLVGGLLVNAFSWRAVYGVLVPLSLVVLVLILRAAPAEIRRPEGAALDVTGALLAVPLVGGPVFALIQGPVVGWASPLVLGALALGPVAIVAFVWWEQRTPNPLLPLLLFRSRSFTVLNLVTFILYAALIASGVYTVLFLQQTAGYSATAAGMASIVPIIVLFFLSKRFGALADRYGPSLFVQAGPAVAGIGILLLLRVDADAELLGVVLPSLLVHGIGLAIVVAPLTSGVLGAVNDGHTGVASGVNNAVARVGGLLGVAVIGLVISMQFSGAVDRELDGRDLSPAARAAVADAEDRPLTSIPTELPDADEHAVLERAFTDASVDAFHDGVIVLGGLALLAAVVAAVSLPPRYCWRAAARGPGGALVGAHQDVADPESASTVLEAGTSNQLRGQV
jgi:EmrB/QacA subfamily drug resistance transporter